LASSPAILATLGLMTAAPALADDVSRSDFHVTTTDGVSIFVRELRDPGTPNGTEPLILVHGARVPGLASFDLDAPGGSLAADLARSLRRPVFVMDARGYGKSDRSEAMSRPPSANRPLSRAYEVVRDIDAVVGAARDRTGAKGVTLFGWATGGMWSAYYASLWPEKVNHLIALNALYGGSERHATLASTPPKAGYALYEAASLFPGWDKSIPDADKTTWRDPVVAEAYARAALASDPDSGGRSPAAFRAPLGAIEDSGYQAGGRRLFDASSIAAALLVIRSENDFWSRKEDADALVHDATRARTTRLVTLPGATHFVHLERPHRGRDRLMAEIAAFLGAER
jgi:pimeloyl-ACP methyl ester carboxylesterase